MALDRKRKVPREGTRPALMERESSLLTTYWSGSTDVFGGPASRHEKFEFPFPGSLTSTFLGFNKWSNTTATRQNHARVMEGVDRFKSDFKDADDFRQPQRTGTN